MMTFEDIRQVITYRMESWAGIPAKDVDYPNAPKTFNPSGKSIWARLANIPGSSSTPEIGGKPCIRRNGTIIIQLFVPVGSSVTRLTATASSLADHFELYHEGHFECLAAQLIDIGDDGHGWYQINLSIAYRTL